MAGGTRDYATIENNKIALKDEPLLTAWEINASWRTVWLKAIARSWQDKSFRAALLTPGGAQSALEAAGFVVPDFFGKLLQVVVVDGDSKGVTYDGSAKVGGNGPFMNGWNDPKGALKATLTLVLPPAPTNAPDYAIALADYDAGGRVYPFTLC